MESLIIILLNYLNIFFFKKLIKDLFMNKKAEKGKRKIQKPDLHVQITVE